MKPSTQRVRRDSKLHRNRVLTSEGESFKVAGRAEMDTVPLKKKKL